MNTFLNYLIAFYNVTTNIQIFLINHILGHLKGSLIFDFLK